MPRPGSFTAMDDPVPVVHEAWLVSVPVWTGAENPASARVRTPNRPACSKSLWWLLYPDRILYDSYSCILYLTKIVLLLQFTLPKWLLQ
jgi:hypothetical protein